MGRPQELKCRVLRNVSFEYEELKEFETLVGRDNVSKELRSMVHNFLTIQKKAEGQNDPLNLSSLKGDIYNIHTIQDIYVCRSEQTEITQFIVNAPDYETLRHLRNRGKQIYDVAHKQIMKRMKNRHE